MEDTLVSGKTWMKSELMSIPLTTPLRARQCQGYADSLRWYRPDHIHTKPGLRNSLRSTQLQD